MQEIDFTHKHLASVGIEFSQGLVKESRVELYNPHSPHKAIYDHGVIFSNLEWKKSHLLQAFLKAASFTPARIVIIDDRLGHVQEMEQAITAMGIECIALRYSAADQQQQNFDPKIAEIQWAYFPYILSDDEEEI